MIEENKKPIFTDQELEDLLNQYWFEPYHFKGVQSRWYLLAKIVRDAVEKKIAEKEPE